MEVQKGVWGVEEEFVYPRIMMAQIISSPLVEKSSLMMLKCPIPRIVFLFQDMINEPNPSYRPMLPLSKMK